MLASYTAEILSRFASNLILTRLLFPEAFGLMASAMALVVSLALISDVGVRAFIIQNRQGEDPSFLRSAWTFQCARGTALWIVLVAASSLLFLPELHTKLPAETVFTNPLFPPVLIALGVMLLAGGFESTAIPLNVRRLNFRPIVIMDLSSRLVSLPITIGCAYQFQSVWSLVLGTLSGSICRTLLSHIIIPGPKMRFSFRRHHFREIISFGKWINLSSVATFAISQSDMLVLGFLIPAHVLGIYYIAKSLVDAIEAFLERLNSSLSLPVLGEVLRRDPANLNQSYYRFRMPLEIVAFTSAGLLFAAGDWIVNFLYDPRYSTVLSFGLLFYPFQLIRGAFTAAGRPQVVAIATVLQAGALAVCIAFGYYLYGTVGAVAGIVASRLFPSLVLITFAFRLEWVSVWKELRFVPMFLFGALAGSTIAHFFSRFALSDLRHLF